MAFDSACTFVLEKATEQCDATSDCTSRGAEWNNYVCGTDKVCVKATDYCETNAQCIDANGGQPFRCLKDERKCAPLLLQPDCRKVWVSKPEDLRNDDVLLVGLVTSNTGKAGQVGIPSIEGAELARLDFMKNGGGLPMGSKNRPIALINCDNNVNPETVIKHLIETVKVHSMLGPENSGVFAADYPGLIEPAGVMAVTGAAIGVQNDPVLTASKGFGKRTTASDALQLEVISKFVPQIEPQIRAKYGIPSTEPIKVLVLNASDAIGLGFASYLGANLVFNGKSAVDNGDNFRTSNYGNPASDPDTKSKQAAAAQAAIAFQPHIIIYGSHSEAMTGLTQPIEDGWTQTRYRPQYIFSSGLFFPQLATFLSSYKDPTVRENLRYRMLGVTPTYADKQVYGQYQLRHKNQWGADASSFFKHAELLPFDGQTDSPLSAGPTAFSASYYDAAYTLFSALIATRKEDPTGREIADAIAMTQPAPGAGVVDCKPESVVPLAQSLVSGQRVDLNGVLSNLDFVEQGGNSVRQDVTIFCLQKADGIGNIGGPVETSYKYGATTHAFTGTAPVDGVFPECP